MVGVGGAAVSVMSPPDGPRIVVPIGAIPAESLTSCGPACEWTAEDGRVMVSWRIGGTVNTIAVDGGVPSRDVMREVIR